MPITVSFDPSQVTAGLRKAAFRGVVRGTEMVRKEMIRLILTGPKTGRVYQRRSVEHQASAPGESPASDTGRLIGSIRTKYDETTLTGTVVIGTSYGLMLEYGTQKMEPRPFARPALANMTDAVSRAIAEEIARG